MCVCVDVYVSAFVLKFVFVCDRQRVLLIHMLKQIERLSVSPSCSHRNVENDQFAPWVKEFWATVSQSINFCCLEMRCGVFCALCKHPCTIDCFKWVVIPISKWAKTLISERLLCVCVQVRDIFVEYLPPPEVNKLGFLPLFWGYMVTPFVWMESCWADTVEQWDAVIMVCLTIWCN